MSWKIFPLSLAPEYRSHWTPADAIRELLQNALDDKSSFDYSFPIGSMIIRSKGVSLPTSTLLLGNTSKKDDDTAVGGFGEGYKIALLILSREGYKVTVRNGNRLWTPFYEYSELYESEMLHIKEEPLEDNHDLTFIIEGVSEDLKEEVISKCLYLQKDLGSVIETNIGRILEDIKGKLYVGGLFVSDTELDYSYDFHPFSLKLNTDRKTVDSWDLKWKTAEIWRLSNSPKDVADLIYNECPDTSHMKYNCSSEIKEECYKTYKKEYGNSPIASNTHEKNKMEGEGYSNVTVTGNECFTEIVKSSNEYKEIKFIGTPKEPMWYIEEIIEIALNFICEEEIESITESVNILNSKGIMWK